jgi:UDP-3-O-[3-hydroxymyristoyl] glucosamine N-acyltransferase
MRLSELQEKVGGDVVGDGSIALSGVGTLERARADQIAFLANPRYRSLLESTAAGAIIIGKRDRDATSKPRLVVDNPYATFARVAQIFSPMTSVRGAIHGSAVLADGVTLGRNVDVAAFVSIGANATLGDNVRIGAGCVIGEGADIGEGTILAPRVVIYPHCQVGRRNVIHSGAVIGADGFGFAPDFKNGEGEWVKIPQTGRVIIGDDCEIGANTTIDRGAIDDTVIGNDVKLDNQIQIGHNCTIGDHTVIAGCVGIAGSSHIGRRVMIGGKAGVIGHLTIADDVIVSAMTLVTKSIAEPGTYTSGTPMQPHREWLKNSVHLKHLGEIADALKKNGELK